ncbi:hypothetical protein M2137_002149 [Parabacteroides sp. PFB2-10]|uniref:fimbrial protein n=1 Tax=Parabacteroides sp. PFB2-10 TaxID=1742405 RepID=UPI00247593F7|nr:fimbrial protein [Parabacteroides sp. PFB2-10]MDH6313359.1 hypothetical protein [Parabacteroides sp. PFB2-10]
MKLRNVLFGMMVAVAFTACSDKGEDIPAIEEGTMLSLKTEKLNTRADGDVNTLTAYVFGTGDILEAIGSVQNSTVIPPFAVTEGQKKVIVLANGAPAFAIAEGVTPLSTFMGATKQLHTEGVSGLSMNSRVYTIQITKNVINYLGYDAASPAPADGIDITPTTGDFTGEIKMFRNVAKIVLGEIDLGAKLADTEETGNTPYYSNPTLTIKDVFVLGAQGTTMLAGGTGEWTSALPVLPALKTFYHGLDDDAYAAYATDKYIKPAASTNLPILDGTLSTQMVSVNGAQVTVDVSKVEGANATFYVYENDADTLSTNTIPHTLLVIAGDLEYDMLVDDGSGEPKVQRTKISNRYWPVPVGAIPYSIKANADFNYANEFLAGGDRELEARADNKYIGIKRNLQYNVKATINSTGYSTPYGGGDKTMLGVQVRVVAWGEVDFDFTIE